MSGEGDDGIDAAAVMAAETNPSCSARPRPPAPVAPGDPAPSAGTRIGRVVAVRKVYERYLSVEQRDVEVDVAGAKVREKERTGLFRLFPLDSFSAQKPALCFYLLSPRSVSSLALQSNRSSSATTSSLTRGPTARSSSRSRSIPRLLREQGEARGAARPRPPTLPPLPPSRSPPLPLRLLLLVQSRRSPCSASTAMASTAGSTRCPRAGWTRGSTAAKAEEAERGKENRQGEGSRGRRRRS